MVPEAISRTWEQISYHIERALPEGENNNQTLNNLLEMFLTGHADCWVSYDEKDKQPNFLVTTVPIYNGITGEKNLLLYNVTNSDSIDLKTSNRMWLEGYQCLMKYMRANRFTKLISYFDDENHRSLKLAKRFGGVVRYYVEVDMTKEI